MSPLSAPLKWKRFSTRQLAIKVEDERSPVRVQFNVAQSKDLYVPAFSGTLLEPVRPTRRRGLGSMRGLAAQITITIVCLLLGVALVVQFRRGTDQIDYERFEY